MPHALQTKLPAVLITLVLLMIPRVARAQHLAETDSIYRLLLETPSDTNLIHEFNGSISRLSFVNNDTSLYYARQQDSISRATGYAHGRAMALNLQGVSHELAGDLYRAIQIYMEAERIAREFQLQFTLSNILNNLGIVYSTLGAYQTSLDYHYKSLELAELLDDSSKIAVNYNNIGLRLSHLSQEERAISNYKKALEINQRMKKNRSASSNYINLGRAYVITKKFDSAIYYYNDGLQLFRDHFPNSLDMALLTNGLAYAYIHLDNLDSARHYMVQTREISEATNDFYGKLEAIELEGQILRLEGKFRAAKQSTLKALELSEAAGLFSNKVEIYRELAEICNELDQHAEAYDYFLEYNSLKDSVFNVKKINEIANIEFTYQVDKQARIDSLNQVQAEQLRLELEAREKYLAGRRNALEYSGIALFALILFLVLMMSRRFRLSNQVLNLLIFVFFLIIFEASLVAFDPLVDRISNGEVIIKVFFNSVLAFSVFTAHHFLEGRMNRFIRNKR